MAYIAATSLEEAFHALNLDGVSVIAGGTDWFPAKGDAPAPQTILDVTGLPGFRGVSRTSQGWRIGGATTWTDIIKAELPDGFDGLKAAAREVGSIQIQNVGTLAGNLCNASPAADGVPPLLTLDAQVELLSSAGTRTMPLGSFLVGPRQTDLRPGELLSGILIPQFPSGAVSGFHKMGARKYMVISIAMVAVLLDVSRGRITDVRIAVGSCSPVAQRLSTLEADLVGSGASDMPPRVTKAHLAPLSPIDDVRASADLRFGAAAELCSRAIHAAFIDAGTQDG